MVEVKFNPLQFTNFKNIHSFTGPTPNSDQKLIQLTSITNFTNYEIAYATDAFEQRN